MSVNKNQVSSRQLSRETKMNTIKILLILFLLIGGSVIAQNVYEVQPGTKGNEIKLTVANISKVNPATEVNVVLTRKPSALSFSKEEETIALIEPDNEEKVSFTFDINRNAPVSKKDTIDFMITSSDGISMMKSFIFNYTPPKEFRLEQNFPNPFNPTTTIQYQLPANARVMLKVYDILGSEVETLVNEEQEAGYKEVQFSGINYASGMYVYRLTAGDYVSIKKMLMIK